MGTKTKKKNILAYTKLMHFFLGTETDKQIVWMQTVQKWML